MSESRKELLALLSQVPPIAYLQLLQSLGLDAFPDVPAHEGGWLGLHKATQLLQVTDFHGLATAEVRAALDEVRAGQVELSGGLSLSEVRHLLTRAAPAPSPLSAEAIADAQRRLSSNGIQRDMLEDLLREDVLGALRAIYLEELGRSLDPVGFSEFAPRLLRAHDRLEVAAQIRTIVRGSDEAVERQLAGILEASDPKQLDHLDHLLVQLVENLKLIHEFFQRNEVPREESRILAQVAGRAEKIAATLEQRDGASLRPLLDWLRVQLPNLSRQMEAADVWIKSGGSPAPHHGSKNEHALPTVAASVERMRGDLIGYLVSTGQHHRTDFEALGNSTSISSVAHQLGVEASLPNVMPSPPQASTRRWSKGNLIALAALLVGALTSLHSILEDREIVRIDELPSGIDYVHVAELVREPGPDVFVTHAATWRRLRFTNSSAKAVSLVSLEPARVDTSGVSVYPIFFRTAIVQDDAIKLGGPQALPLRLDPNSATDLFALTVSPVPRALGRALLTVMRSAPTGLRTETERALFGDLNWDDLQASSKTAAEADLRHFGIHLEQLEINAIHIRRNLLAADGSSFRFLDAQNGAEDGFDSQEWARTRAAIREETNRWPRAHQEAVTWRPPSVTLLGETSSGSTALVELPEGL